MLTFLIRRLLLTIPALFGVALVVFLLMRAIPGDVVTQLVGVGQDISAERMDELRHAPGPESPGASSSSRSQLRDAGLACPGVSTQAERRC